MKYEVKDLNAPSRWNMRIWDDDKKEWLCQSDKDALTYYGFDITGGETTEFQGLPKWHPDRHLIWEQSTGFKDKNGKEIYEGDIIKVVNVHDGDEECWEQPYGLAIPQEVKWDEERLRWSFGGCKRILYEPEDFEVIGNIHENPELLGGEE